MSAKKNDNTIIKLQKQVDKKRKALTNAQQFIPCTNCSIEVDNIRYNLQVLDTPALIALLVRLNAYKTSAEELGVIDKYIISGYSVLDWLTDIKAKLAYLDRKNEQRRFKIMEVKLNKLLSNEKRVELELDDIAAELIKA